MVLAAAVMPNQINLPSSFGRPLINHPVSILSEMPKILEAYMLKYLAISTKKLTDTKR